MTMNRDVLYLIVPLFIEAMNVGAIIMFSHLPMVFNVNIKSIEKQVFRLSQYIVKLSLRTFNYKLKQ